MAQKDTIRVAAGQIQAHPLSEAEESLKAIERVIHLAADQQAELLVLPECAYPAYLLGSLEDYRRAKTLPVDEYFIFLTRWARKKKLHIVSGYVEDVGTCLYNSAVLIDDGGQVLGSYRKSFLWAADNHYFKPGERIPTFETRFGRIGMVICADARAPEILAKEVNEGVRLIAMPTCWVNTAQEPGVYENPQPEFLISARAKEFGVPFVCANKFGLETEKVGYCGRSLIADSSGQILQEASGEGEGVVVQDIVLPEIQTEVMQSELWEGLMHWPAPMAPEVKHDGELKIALWPGQAKGAEELEQLIEQGVTLAIADGLADDAVQFDGQIGVILPGHIGPLHQSVIGPVGCLWGEDVIRFGRTRLMALGGMSVLCVFDTPDDLNLLRTRAIENRIFVLAMNEQLAMVITPSGEVKGYSSFSDREPLIVEINPIEAVEKRVAPGTDIWEQRRVETYKSVKS